MDQNKQRRFMFEQLQCTQYDEVFCVIRFWVLSQFEDLFSRKDAKLAEVKQYHHVLSAFAGYFFPIEHHQVL